MIVEALLYTAALAVASFAAAGVLVVALTRTLRLLGDGPGPGSPERGWYRPPRRFGRGREPAWWPEFERAFADYVRTGAGREP